MLDSKEISPDRGENVELETELSVVICGSYHRGKEELIQARRSLAEAGARVLSPLDLDFVDERDGFLFAAHEVDEQPGDIEERHLGAMRIADFVWLHAPDGYIGTSAAVELGFAYAQGLTVYSTEPPEEPAFLHMVRVVRDPASAVAACTPERLAADAPTKGLKALQSYYARAAALRGWDAETSEETVRLLAGEVEELAIALRETKGMTQVVSGEDPELELADVALYLVHLSNALDVDLGAAISAKEQINARRFQPTSVV